MESSSGFIAVLAVSGTVVLLAAQFHKRLLSDYMDRLELQPHVKNKKDEKEKKKVRFAEDVMEPSGNNKEYRMKNGILKLEDGSRRRSVQNTRVL